MLIVALNYFTKSGNNLGKKLFIAINLRIKEAILCPVDQTCFFIKISLIDLFNFNFSIALIKNEKNI